MVVSATRQASQKPTMPDAAKRAIKVLIFPPHADDEAFMGGLIARSRRELPHVGFKAHLMTDGFVEELRLSRRREFERSCGILGIEPAFMGFEPTNERLVPDHDSLKPKSVRYFSADHAFVSAIARVLAEEKPDAVLVTHLEDKHPDHIVTCKTLESALYELSRAGVMLNIAVLYAPVWGDLANPNLYIGFEQDIYDLKRRALAQHDSQLSEAASRSRAFNNYQRMMHGRAEFSAAAGPELLFGFGSKGVNVQYAELFEAQSWTIAKSGDDKPVLSRIRARPRLFLPSTPLTEDIFFPVVEK